MSCYGNATGIAVLTAALLFGSNVEASASRWKPTGTLQQLQDLELDLDPAVSASFQFFDESAADGGRGLLEALLVPGLNQARRGDWVRASIFAGVEVLSLVMQKKLNDDGDELDREFRDFADANWSMFRYTHERVARGEFAYEEDWLEDPDESQNGLGSHVLPVAFAGNEGFGNYGWWDREDNWELIPTQQFYEMIGKYAQFQRGWDDYNPDGGWTVTTFSALSNEYQALRVESNDKLKAADAWIGLLVANHALSLIETFMKQRGSSGRRLNLGVRQLRPDVIPVNTLQMSWSF